MSMDALRARIGDTLRTERERLGWSAAELARRASVSKASVSQLEAGKANPNVETLWALSDALGVPFSALVDEGEPSATLIRVGEGDTIAAATTTYSATLLSASPPQTRRDIYLIRADPGAARNSAPHQSGTREHVILVAGSAEVGPTAEAVTLHPGDYVTYAGDEPHVFRALEAATVAVLLSELR